MADEDARDSPAGPNADGHGANLPEGFPAQGTFAEKLDWLSRNVYPRGRDRPYTLQEIAAAAEVSPGYVQQLRAGRKTDPTIGVVERLAGFFRIPAAAFFNEAVARQVADELSLFLVLRDSDVHSVATRMYEMDPETRGAIRRVVEQIARSNAHGSKEGEGG
jgi:transcriptional regulator with XRE-family HTH domain